MRYSVLIVGLLLTSYGLSVGTSTAHAQPFPNRPIQLIIPNVPGSIMDINARVLTDDLGKTLGTQVIVIDKPGAA